MNNHVFVTAGSTTRSHKPDSLLSQGLNHLPQREHATGNRLPEGVVRRRCFPTTPANKGPRRKRPGSIEVLVFRSVGYHPRERQAPTRRFAPRNLQHQPESCLERLMEEAREHGEVEKVCGSFEDCATPWTVHSDEPARPAKPRGTGISTKIPRKIPQGSLLNGSFLR